MIDRLSVWLFYLILYLFCGNVQLSSLYLCTTVCLLITPFQSPGECFCRFKTILLALCGNPWIWIACPPTRIHWRKIFFFPLQHWLKISRGLNILPIFFYCHHQNVTKCANCFPSTRRSRGVFFHLPSIPFLPHQFKHFWIIFFLFWQLMPPYFFLSLITPINKKW